MNEKNRWNKGSKRAEKKSEKQEVIKTVAQGNNSENLSLTVQLLFSYHLTGKYHSILLCCCWSIESNSRQTNKKQQACTLR